MWYFGMVTVLRLHTGISLILKVVHTMGLTGGVHSLAENLVPWLPDNNLTTTYLGGTGCCKGESLLL